MLAISMIIITVKSCFLLIYPLFISLLLFKHDWKLSIQFVANRMKLAAGGGKKKTADCSAASFIS